MARKKSYAKPDPDMTEASEPDEVEDVATSFSVGSCPPMPAKGPLGDLTPEIIEWFRQYDPAEFEARYIRPGHPKGARIPIR